MNEIKFKKSILGYDFKDVNNFIEEVVKEYEEKTSVSEELVTQYRKLLGLNEELQNKLKAQSCRISEWETACIRLHEENQSLRKLAETNNASTKRQAIGQAMVNAEVFATGKIAAAKAEAEEIISQSQLKANKIIEDAENKLAKARATRNEFVGNLEQTLKSIFPEHSLNGTRHSGMTIDFP